MELDINGQRRQVTVPPEMPLLWVLRDVLNLTGTKYGCGVAACGACTVLVDGVAARSCVRPVSSMVGKRIETIEGLGTADKPHPVQLAWIAEQVPQCGYCQSGMVMAVVSMLDRSSPLAEAEIDAVITNICRCGTYQRVRAAIHRAAQSLLASRVAETTLSARSAGQAT